MTLDERAARAAEGIHRAVVDAAIPGDAATIDRRREPRYLMAVVAVITAAVIVVAFAIAHEVGTRQHLQPARPGPDGKLLFGQWHPAVQESSWFTIDPDGRHITSLHVTATCASWGPGGGNILISDDAYAHAGHPLRPATIHADGTGLHRLDAARSPHLNLGCGQVAPNGRTIVLEGFGDSRRADVSGIYLVRASDGGGLTPLTRSPAGSSDSDPRFAPDGQHIVFLRSAANSGVEGSGTLYVTTTTGADPRRITPQGFAFLGYDWSPDGQWIVFQHPYGQLYVVHPDGTGLHRIPVHLPAGAGAQNPVWSPDSSTIAFSLVRNDRANIYTVRLDGSHLRQVTNNSGVTQQTPDWSR